ncbi:MAG: hypothetical protein NVSMB42_12580 [Herpetosiphon sp.]
MRGPFGLLLYAVIAGVMLAGIIISGRVAIQGFSHSVAVIDKTATVAWATANAQATEKAQAAAALALVTPVGVTGGQAKVKSSANMRAEPRLDPSNLLGTLEPGTEVEVLEGSPPVNPQWYRVRITQGGGQLKAGAQGWMSAPLLILQTGQTNPTTAPAPLPAAVPGGTARP